MHDGAEGTNLSLIDIHPTVLVPEADLERQQNAGEATEAVVASLIGAKASPDEVSAAVQSVLAERNANA